MDGPAPPKDTGLKNIIDKLAEFVARNGPEFENITRTKQQGNPRFSFLFGGEYYQYYQWRVSNEQSVLKQQQLPIQNWNNAMPPHQNPQSRPIQSGPPMVNLPNLSRELESIVTQQSALREQIRQSELNLTAQHNVLMQKQQKEIDEAIEKAQSDSIMKQAEENDINLSEFDTILQPIIEACTKDSISGGKNWILQHGIDAPKSNAILQYLLKKALVTGVTFTQKLHLIYLVNDILHHCVRKNAEDLKNNLENIVIPMFCSAEIIASEDQKSKLLKLLSLWESKLNFFDACVISKLRSPNSSMQEYKTNLLNFHHVVVNNIQQQTQAAFENYKQQHTAFVQHASQQIQVLDTQKIQLEQQQKQQNFINQIPPLMSQTCDVNNLNGNSMHGNSIPPQQILQGINMNYMMPQTRPTESSFENFQNPEPPTQGSNVSGQAGYQLPPPNFFIPDLSKPPPGFSNPVAIPPGAIQGQQIAVNENVILNPIPTEVQPQQTEEIKPTVPYYELPAGLMVPLIRLEDYNYRPLDPEEIRLPPPTAPSERLIQAIEAFYSHPSHDRPRDGEGWEKLGLYEYYKVKNSAKKMKEEEIQKGSRDSSRSPSPIVIEVVKPKRINKRTYRSKSRSRSKSKSRSKTRSKSRTPSPPTRPRSPIIRQPRRNNNRHYSHTSPKRGGKSPVNIRSQTPPMQNSRKERDRNRNRERDTREWSRSPPPSFGNFASKTANDCIEETNKGHQLLMKMGWGGSGTGLGAQAQGIDEPISAGEIRDRQDMYKGIGVSLNDPYENFRKNKGAAFINRMRSRDNERKKTKHQVNQNSDEPPDY